MICVPKTCEDTDTVGFVIEAMCRESHDTVAKAFYETALKGKYARDAESLEMIELIRSNLTFDGGWVSSMATGISGNKYQEMMENGVKDFSSWFASNQATLETAVAKYLDAYKD